MQNEKLRNVAIIAHVDHGKTTLVDEMLKQGGVYRENQETVERVMDSGDLERERGITILAKNTAIRYGDTKINIVDTPGHADFGGEVERILKMVNGVILLVDAAEGPMPQTRFVLSRALELGHRVIVVVNKIDRPDRRIHEVVDEVLELLLELDANDEQLDSPMLFCSARNGTASYSPDTVGTDLKPLFDTILDYIPAPDANVDEPFQMLVSSIDYNEFVGRIAIGRIERGTLRQNQEIAVCNYHDPDAPAKRAKAVSLYQFEGLSRIAVPEADAGNIIALSGIGDVTIGDTICAPECVEPLPFVKISAPTVEMTFSVNDSPFAGREGKYVTSRQLRDRLWRETLKDVSLRVSEIEGAMDAFNVAGRGEMSLSILIETMRREGYEFQVSPPRVLYRTIDGVRCEPVERLVVDVPAESVGAVIEKLGSRKGDLVEMNPVGSRMKLEFRVPSRGLFGYRNEFLTDTRGEGIMASVFDSYAPYKGELQRRNTGSLVSFETGESVSYGLFNAQDRGALFIGPGVAVYEGMVVGVSPKAEDITVNVCRKKQMTNMRAAGSDEALRLTPPRRLSLEQCLEFLADDELLEVTPENLRIRKTILNHEKRMKASHGGKKK
ncbi:MAG: translational GTPase TypA [Oscillospiraceae bacterium]|nr:translational GTPase TypA [Oscillospiraceae bacterium]